MRRACWSPQIALSIRRRMVVSSLVTVRFFPFSLITTFSFNVASIVLDRLRRPLGLPRRLPETPFL